MFSIADNSKTPDEKYKDIREGLKQLKSQINRISGSAEITVLQQTYNVLISAENRLQSYQGDAPLVSYINAHAADYPAIYGVGYTVQADYSNILTIIGNLKTGIAGLNYSSPLTFDTAANWAQISTTSLTAGINNFNTLVP